ncbi:amidohydrolase family protein [Sneathiella sp. P13V-1]|uniref:amidohydrolase family protein n=1 Tax=Sneathiella sp. P13V-1 TaxID=2697366 RepID=UPI00187B3804|nr:amidohydrolase family protein [Sneathiella sp. P13V-1]MBE7635229.1 amidohydrolase family protein [Sneathiella sp. P13V-1]
MLDLLVKNARLAGTTEVQDIAVKDGKIVEVAPKIDGDAARVLDASGYLVTTPFVDSHFHMDSTLTYGRPRVNESGTLLEGIALWSEVKPLLDATDIKKRAHDFCRWAIAKGNLAIRSHVDICDPSLLAVEALLEVVEEVKPYLDLQLVAFPQDGFYRDPKAEEQLIRALDKGVHVVGGIPHFERTMADGAASVKALCELAAERGLMVDMHCDESDDPMSRHVETLACETTRLGLEGRVTGSHLTSMHSMDNYYVSKLMALMAEAELHAVANPLINITLQARHDTYPKRRGMTRVKELMEAGINVAFGHDCVMDPWYSLGTHDMLEVASMGLHVGQMTGQDQMRQMFRAVTTNGAKALGLEGYGLDVGCYADFVVLQARDEIEALRLRPARLHVIRRGKEIATTPKQETMVFQGEEAHKVDFLLS